MTTDFNLIGGGRLGTNIARALLTQLKLELLGICNSNLASAHQTREILNAGTAFASVKELPAADLTFITTPDNCIANVADALLLNPAIKPGQVFVHCSGALSSTLLAPLQDRGCHVASLHPFKSFVPNQTQTFSDCYCTVEGDVTAIERLTTLFGQLGAKVISLHTAHKHLYHAAASMAANYLVTLAASATSLLIDANIAPRQAKHMCEQLMGNTLQNIQGVDEIAQALTGPLMRQDLETIKRHLHAINLPHVEGLYRAAGLATLPLINTSEDTLVTLTSLLTNA
jgi:predicted short-subunit dehydrogenase-like oxidoreductase (DUF2520 family)